MSNLTTDQQERNSFFDQKVLGHPAGLFVLFFTEMWERFSFYGMRVLLVNFLTMAAISYNPGWEWTAENAGALFGTYAMLLYITPILGGIIADKLIGYNWAVVVGAIVMTAGHGLMALETEFSLYGGLALLVIGTGFFKPNITSIISEMYKDFPEKKDGAYTIFYMGVNAGAFFGMLLCGYLAEKIGWSYGFGLAGIFMLLGTLQFWLAKPLFGHIGDVPTKEEKAAAEAALEASTTEKRNPFTMLDKVLIVISAIIGLGYAINDPMSKIAEIDLFGFAKIGALDGQYVVVLIGLALFLYLVISRITRYSAIVRDRMIAFIIFAFFTVFFWMSFEQGASSLVIFARDFVGRSLSGGAATTFNIVNTLLTVIPLLIVTYVLYLLAKRSFKRIPGSNIVLGICFIGVWAVMIWMLNRDWNTKAYQVGYEVIENRMGDQILPERQSVFADKLLASSVYSKSVKDGEEVRTPVAIDSVQTNGVFLVHKTSDKKNKKAAAAEQKSLDNEYISNLGRIQNYVASKAYYTVEEKNAKTGKKEKIVKTIPMSDLYYETIITEGYKVYPTDNKVQRLTKIAEPIDLVVGQDIQIIRKDKDFTQFGYLTEERLALVNRKAKELGVSNGVMNAKVVELKQNEVEITVSWFSILNSFFIIAFASLFSKWFDSKYNPPAAVKYGLGLIIMAIGFGLLALGSYGIADGVKVSMVWLILAYLFHTLGELSISPVGLSYVSKLVPGRMIAFMFGMWYLAIAIGNKLAAVLGGEIENITEKYSISTFFLIFTIVPIIAGIVVMLLNPLLKRLMHGVK